MSAELLKGRRFLVRSVDLDRRLDVFLVAAIGSVIGNRVFLVLTGYPQVGNGVLHISHAIWGGLMMAIAVILATAYLSPAIRTVVPIVGGIGFGFFVDEIGKFITRDVNYFFRPAFSLIYLIFVAMVFAFQGIERKRFGPNEGVINALEALKAATLGQLDEPRRHAAIDLLRSTNAPGGLADRVATLLDEVPVLAPNVPSRACLARQLAPRDGYYRWTDHGSFVVAVTVLFLLRTGVLMGGIAIVVLDGAGIRGFSEWMTVLGESVSTVLTVIGVFRLRASREQAYRWFDRSLLVSLLFTQIFLFEQEQLAGTIGLAVTLVYWVALRAAIQAERAHAREATRQDSGQSWIRSPADSGTVGVHPPNPKESR